MTKTDRLKKQSNHLMTTLSLAVREPDPPAAPPLPPPVDSLILSDWPSLFAEFHGKQFTLLWRGSRDGFGARDFHGRCDWRANTLTLILDTDGNVFGGFTPLKWVSGCTYKCDDSLKTFLFTLKNPHNIPAMKFALRAEEKESAIDCDFSCGPAFGPQFGDIHVWDDCNANTCSSTCLGRAYTNSTERDGDTVFTGSEYFQVREIEVFEITG
jgi:hypothetical protein